EELEDRPSSPLSSPKRRARHDAPRHSPRGPSGTGSNGMTQRRSILAALFATVLFGGAASAAETTLHFVPQADLSVIDPHWTAAYITRNHGYMVYDTLFALDHDFRPRPQMVESWSASADQLSWTFTL